MNRFTKLFGIEKPIIQAGMIWCSPWQLASSVSNHGGLGVIGAGSMYPEVLEEHIIKCKKATKKPFAVNLPLLYPDIEKHIETIIKYKVPVVITSAGNPKTWTAKLKAEGIKVIHVISSAKFAKKSELAGVDAVVAEGFEAGGHNGREETTTLTLIQNVVDSVSIPVIAAGGIATGKAMLAVMALGADAVQIGSRFVVAKESSAHENFKNRIIKSGEGDTSLTLKEITPVRLIKNEFFEDIQKAYVANLGVANLKELLGRGRAKKGMFEGDMAEGELEIGQVATYINSIQSAAEIMDELMAELKETKEQLTSEKFDF
ncbi:MAG: enoyl-[acyl-carrier protein] reductase II [Salibacteraceae bacterium]|jgi:enoyl-[acyl-carrier protein] reductase II